MSSSITAPPMMIPLEHPRLAVGVLNRQNYLHPFLPVTNLWCQTLDQSGRADDRGPWLTREGSEPTIEGTTRGDLLIFGQVTQDGELVKQIDPIPGHEAEGLGRGFERWTLENLRYEGEFLNGIPNGEFQLFQRAENDKEWYMHQPVYRGRFDWFVVDDQPHFRLTGQMYSVKYYLDKRCLLLRSSGSFDSSTGEFTGTIYGSQHEHWSKLIEGRYHPEKASGEGEVFRDGRLIVDGGFIVNNPTVASPHGRASRFNYHYGTLCARGTFHHGILEEGELYAMHPGSDQTFLWKKGMFSNNVLSHGELFYPSNRPAMRKQLTDEWFEVTEYFDVADSPISKVARHEKSASGRLTPGKLIESRKFNLQKQLIEHVHRDSKKEHTHTFFDDGRPKSRKTAWVAHGGWEFNYEELFPNGRMAKREVAERESDGHTVRETIRTSIYSESGGPPLAEYTKASTMLHGPMTVNNLHEKPIAQLNFRYNQFHGEQLLFRDGQLTHHLTVTDSPRKMIGQMFYPSGELKFEGEFHLLPQISPATTPDVFERGYYFWGQKIKPKKGTMRSESGERVIDFDDSDTFTMLSAVESMLHEVEQRDTDTPLGDEYAEPSQGLKRARC